MCSPPERFTTQAGDMTPTTGIPTLALSDDHSIPVLGLCVAELPPTEAEAAVTAALQAGYRLIDTTAVEGNEEAVGRAIAASGLRMAYEVYTQLLGRAGARQLSSPSVGLTHNLGGVPYQGIAAISILGLYS